MTNAQHTPGPWVIEKWTDSKGNYRVAVEDIDIYCGDPHKYTREDEARVSLIAAAPELLKALQAYVESDDVGALIGTEKYKNARAAIAKATNHPAGE